ncbi:viperin family antiviral radical SAM protein [Marinifilum fragile]|uniref:viperin family antiviral radical SAM protein n=1 Tax=Marinifilum fragile TaxID=570161 RepID=UPI002AAA755E|nr:viperin family antiviral radical SAM protein [Marinifilum fragile]
MYENNFIPSVNFHLWEPCNMKCKFCFASFQDVKKSILPKGHLSKEDALEVIRELANLGFQKISSAGGEPTLCPWLNELIAEAKSRNMTTMLITNGTNLSTEFLEQNKSNLDWIALSIDSLNKETNQLSGRSQADTRTLSKEHYLKLIQEIKREGYKLKINTVIHRFNYQEDMTDFMIKTNPQRWKVMQVLPIKGQNDKHIKSLEISDRQFSEFINKHKHISSYISETNNDMTNSYVMVDPAGRFFENSKGIHKYSQPILKVSAKAALQEMNYDYSKFVARKGIYNWK